MRTLVVAAALLVTTGCGSAPAPSEPIADTAADAADGRAALAAAQGEPHILWFWGAH